MQFEPPGRLVEGRPEELTRAPEAVAHGVGVDAERLTGPARLAVVLEPGVKRLGEARSLGFAKVRERRERALLEVQGEALVGLEDEVQQVILRHHEPGRR